MRILGTRIRVRIRIPNTALKIGQRRSNQIINKRRRKIHYSKKTPTRILRKAGSSRQSTGQNQMLYLFQVRKKIVFFPTNFAAKMTGSNVYLDKLLTQKSCTKTLAMNGSKKCSKVGPPYRLTSSNFLRRWWSPYPLSKMYSGLSSSVVLQKFSV